MNFIEIHGAEYMLFYEKSNQKDKIVSILKEADEVIALSAEWKKKFDETFGLKNCVVLENGIDTERLKPAITSVKDHPWKNPKSVFYISKVGIWGKKYFDLFFWLGVSSN